MLVEDKFLFLSLPRRASTAFMTTCIFNRFKIECADPERTNQIKFLYEDNIFDIDIVRKKRLNQHIPYDILFEKFSNNFPLIAIKRNPYEKFISHYNHCLDALHYFKEFKVLQKIQNLDIEKILFFSNDRVNSDYDNINFLVKEFAEINGIYELFESKYHRLEWFKVFTALYVPDYAYTGYNTNILWFDFKKLYELEEWVSDTVKKDFKLMKVNDSKKETSSNLKIDEKFIKKYDELYGKFDNPKIIKTLI